MSNDSIGAKLDTINDAVDDLSQRVDSQQHELSELSGKMSRILDLVDGNGQQAALNLRVDRIERERIGERLKKVEDVVLQLEGVRWGAVKSLAILAWVISVALPILLKLYG